MPKTQYNKLFPSDVRMRAREEAKAAEINTEGMSANMLHSLIHAEQNTVEQSRNRVCFHIAFRLSRLPPLSPPTPRLPELIR